MLSKLMMNHIPVDIAKMRRGDFIENENKLKTDSVNQVNAGSGWRKVISCPVCGCVDSKPELVTFWAPLVKCSNCELRYHTLIPNDFGDLYNSSSYTTHGKGEEIEHFEYRKKRFGTERVKLLESHVGQLGSKILLDVGCGMGDFLAAAKGGFLECIGSEFSDHQRALAQKNTEMVIYKESLSEFPRKNIDIITAFDVIEHVPNPTEFMRDAAKLLSAESYLMLYTPNFDSFSIKVIREKSSLIAPAHIQLFNHKSLRIMGKLSGFEIIHVETRGLDMASIGSYYELEEGSAPTIIHKWSEELQAVLNETQTADYLRVIYKKM